MVTAPLSGSIDFDALSYAWGAPKDTVPISINDKQVQVTKNLHAALSAFRRNGKMCTRLLWVDAVCINQKDVAERSHQVQLMKEIYSRAGIVHIWMGLRGSATQALFDKMDSVCSGTPVSTIIDDNEAYAEFVRIMHLGWWKRIWVVQEAVLANVRIVWLGSARIPLDTIILACRAVTEASFNGEARHFQREVRTDDIWLYQSRVNRFEQNQEALVKTHIKGVLAIFTTVQYCECSDMRDHIYGLLGLLPSSLNLVPDYTQSVIQVYEASTLHIMQWSKSLELLRLRFPAEADPTLPSWVADFRRVGAYANHEYEDEDDGYRASGTLTCFLAQPQPGALTVRMHEIDRIKAFSEYWRGEDAITLALQDGGHSLRRIFREWRTGAELYARPGADSTQFSVDFWRTVAADKMSSVEKGGWKAELVSKEAASRLDAWLDADEDEAGSTLNPQIISVLSIRAFRHTFFYTETGRMGNASEGPRVDDIVAVLAGLSRPIILRRLPETSKKRYRVITTCYCQGKQQAQKSEVCTLQLMVSCRRHVRRTGSRCR